MSTQLVLFEELSTKVEKPQPPTRVRVGSHVAEINLHRKRKEALGKLLAVLDELQGKDVYIGSYGGAHNHFWTNNLKLERLRVERIRGGGTLPGVIVLWGSKEASVRIFTDQVVSLRQQEHQGYTLWLLDFWNGFGEHPIDHYRPIGYVSLHIVRFKEDQAQSEKKGE